MAPGYSPFCPFRFTFPGLYRFATSFICTFGYASSFPLYTLYRMEIYSGRSFPHPFIYRKELIELLSGWIYPSSSPALVPTLLSHFEWITLIFYFLVVFPRRRIRERKEADAGGRELFLFFFYLEKGGRQGGRKLIDLGYTRQSHGVQRPSWMLTVYIDSRSCWIPSGERDRLGAHALHSPCHPFFLYEVDEDEDEGFPPFVYYRPQSFPIFQRMVQHFYDYTVEERKEKQRERGQTLIQSIGKRQLTAGRRFSPIPSH